MMRIGIESSANDAAVGKRLRRLPFFLLLAGALILLWGCQASDSNQRVVSQVLTIQGDRVEVTRVVPASMEIPPTVTPDPEKTEQAVLDLGLSDAPTALDPQLASSDSELHLVENLFVGLTRFNHAQDSVEPDLAREWEVSEDGLTWTFHLRPDIFWVKSGLHPPTTSLLPRDTEPQPYRPVVAGDVVFAIRRACDPQNDVPDAVVLFLIEGCEEAHSMVEPEEEELERIGVRAPDDTTLEITLREPAAYFPTITTLPLMRPVPEEIVSAFDDSGQSWAAPDMVLTSGRFVLDAETEADTHTILIRNPYWPDRFRGTVDLVNIYWMEPDEAYEAWLEKDLDVSPMAASELDAIVGDPSLRPRLHLVSNQATFYLSFNTESEVFSDPAVRRAFSAAIDRQQLIEEVYAGLGAPMRHFSPPGVLGAPPADQVGVGYDPDWARRQMATSQFQDCQFLPEVRYRVANTDLALHHAETLRRMWEQELGCPEEQIVIEQVPFGTLLADTRRDAGQSRPDLWDLGWTSYYPDAHNWLADVLHCNLSENRQNRSCSQVDNLIEQAASARSVEERWSLYREAEQQLFGDDGAYPVAPVFVQARHVLIQPWLEYDPARFGGEQYDTYQLDATTKRLEREQ
ncbi:MAG: peptide ABC transporter substrate-binding protein [bacterium]